MNDLLFQSENKFDSKDKSDKSTAFTRISYSSVSELGSCSHENKETPEPLIIHLRMDGCFKRCISFHFHISEIKLLQKIPHCVCRECMLNFGVIMTYLNDAFLYPAHVKQAK